MLFFTLLKLGLIEPFPFGRIHISGVFWILWIAELARTCISTRDTAAGISPGNALILCRLARTILQGFETHDRDPASSRE